MSRSYKHAPVYKEGSKRGRKWRKKNANSRLRAPHLALADIPSGKSYRKITNPWDICDFVLMETFRQHVGHHQSFFDSMLEKYGEEEAERFSKDWRELYGDWARLYLWK